VEEKERPVRRHRGGRGAGRGSPDDFHNDDATDDDSDGDGGDIRSGGGGGDGWTSPASLLAEHTYDTYDASMSLPRQKALSTAHNEQLQKEVGALREAERERERWGMRRART
jgi:hypothetical protein